MVASIPLIRLDVHHGRIFNHALACHPELDIALVNMANTLRDMVSPELLHLKAVIY